jgi:hypothetical protein
VLVAARPRRRASPAARFASFYLPEAAADLKWESEQARPIGHRRDHGPDVDSWPQQNTPPCREARLSCSAGPRRAVLRDQGAHSISSGLRLACLSTLACFWVSLRLRDRERAGGHTSIRLSLVKVPARIHIVKRPSAFGLTPRQVDVCPTTNLDAVSAGAGWLLPLAVDKLTGTAPVRFRGR